MSDTQCGDIKVGFVVKADDKWWCGWTKSTWLKEESQICRSDTSTSGNVGRDPDEPLVEKVFAFYT